MNSSPGIPNDKSSPGTAGTGMSFVVGFFFSFRLFIMLVSVRFLGTDPQTGVELSLALNFLLLVLVAFSSLGQTHRTLGSMLKLWSIRWVLFFLVFSGSSLVWSSAASMPAAIAFWCAMTDDVAMVALLLRADPVIDVADSLMRGFIWGACCIALIAWIMPAQSDLRLGDEELLGPNQIGYLCAFAMFFAQYLIRDKKEKWGCAVLLLGITLLRSLSKTTIVAFLLSEAFILIGDRSMKRKTKLLLAVGAGIVVLAFWGLLESYYDVYTNAGNQAETLTGRIGIWAFILEAALDQPWFGHGFHSVWKVIPPFGEFEARHAHNELLQQFYAYGIIGICMLAGLYGSLYKQSTRLMRSPLKTFVVGMLIFVLVRGLADTEPFDVSLPLWAIVLLSLLIAHSRRTSEEMEFHALSEKANAISTAQFLPTLEKGPVL
jgi:exopolysaccharide production protein ExoQ